MLFDIIDVVSTNPWVLAAGTVFFFTAKGLAWLILPAMVLRLRKWNRARKRD